ncbi:hypothetical protein KEM52_004541 [Ascosphaera acerosa]|nr:hypothetical protein KEM52_004541 [Ascosphaera acerosa]
MLNPPPATTHLLQCIRSQLSWLVLTFSTQLSEGDNDVNGHRVALHVSVALWAGIIRHLVNPRFTIDELCTVVSYIPDIEAERIMQAGDDFISMFLRIPETLKVYQAIAQVRPQLKNMLCMRLASAGLTPLPATTYATYGVGC